MESNAIVVKEAIVVMIVVLHYYFKLHLSCISMAGLHQRADNGRRSCSAPPPENQELSASLQQCNNPVTGKVHFTPKGFSVMHSMHQVMSAFCPRENPEMIFFFMRLLIQMLVQWCRTRSWFQKVHSEDDFFVSNKRIVFFKPLFLLTKLKSRHAERTQFEGYSVAKGRVSLLKASSGYPVFKMHLLKVAKVNILCLSCTQNLLQSVQLQCTQLCSCSGAIALKK